MKRVSLSRPRVFRCAALAAAAAALALTMGGPDALLGPFLPVVLGVLAIPFFEWTSVPAGLARVMPRGVALGLFVVAAIAWLSRAMGVLIVEPALLPAVAGPAVLAAAVLFALAPRSFAPGRSLMPATIGVLAVAGLDPRPDGYRVTALSFLKGSEHSAFAERYIALAIILAGLLWAAAFLERGPRWQWRNAFTLAIAVASAAALAATGVVGLPLFQPHVEKAFASAFAEASTGLGGESRLGEFASLAVSRRRVLDLQTSLESGGAWHLPSEVFTAFDGQRWSSPVRNKSSRQSLVLRPTAAPLSTGPVVEGLGNWFVLDEANGLQPLDDAHRRVELRVTQAEVTSWPLLVPRGTTAVTAAAYILSRDRHGLVRRPDGDAIRLYGGLWAPPSPLVGLVLAPDERQDALALPGRIDPRLADFARTLFESADGPRQQVEAVVRHLHSGYRYTLAPGAFRTDDPVAEFLFEKRAGYCEYFASAAVLLLRLQGVPARFVKGLATGPNTDQGGGLHVVRESDAHAWVEAWVPGEGWIEADPTPPGDFLAQRRRASFMSRLTQRVRAALASAWQRISARGPVEFLSWLAGRVAASALALVREPLVWLALAAVLVARLVLRALPRFRRRAPTRDTAEAAVRADLRALVRSLERRWAAAGCPRPPGRGLHEHALRLAARKDAAPELAATVAEAGPPIVEAYYRARFGGKAASGELIESLRARL